MQLLHVLLFHCILYIKAKMVELELQVCKPHEH